MNYIKNQARSYLRNPLIAEIFYLTKDVEKWGSGLKRIDEECRANNINVNFKVVETGFVTTFIRPVMEEKNLQNISVADTAIDTVKDTVKDTAKLLSKNEKKIVEQIKRNSKVTADELSEIVDINLRNIRRNLKKLKKKGLLKRIGPAKGGHWELIDL